MKSLKNIITMFALVAIAMSAQAQKPIQEISQAFDEFYGKLYKNNYVTSASQGSYTGGEYKIIYFSLPASKSKVVNEYDNILFDNGRLAYSSLVKKAGTQDDTQLSVSYKEDNGSTINFGSNKEHNYNVQVIRNLKDSTMRYAYALVWYPDNNNILGSAYKIYGKDPRQSKNLIGNIYKSLSVDSTETYENLSDNDILQKFTNLQMIYSKLNDKYKDYKEFSGSDRLEMLNTRRLMIATNNQIRMLLNTWRLGNALSNDDKEFIADQLAEMSNESKDKWLKKSLKDLSTSLIKK